MSTFNSTDVPSPVQSVSLVWKFHSLSVILLFGMGVLEDEKSRDVYEALQDIYGQLLDQDNVGILEAYLKSWNSGALDRAATRGSGKKGFCNHCVQLAKLIEENVDVDIDGNKCQPRLSSAASFVKKLHDLAIKDLEANLGPLEVHIMNKDSEENVEISNLTNALDEAHIKNKDKSRDNGDFKSCKCLK
uniref:Uncharacterized protein n=1 Tax=Fagus sylvatica TaxID=28930 RepID=A0A2N9FRH7_FAGSY